MHVRSFHPTKFRLLLSIFFAAFTGALFGQTVVINELMNSNGSTILDEDGDSPDWIEFYNDSDSSVDLEGYGLSDDQDLHKWVFPSAIIPPREYLVVFASGKDRRAPVPHWETVIDWEDVWAYIIPSSEPNASWRQPGFSAAGWSTGQTGIGYGDNDDRTRVPSGTTSVYARKTFQVDDPTSITHLFFDIDFDDGFVAFLNGVEIAREAIEGNLPRYSDTAVGFTEPRLVFGRELFHYELSDIQSLLRAGENVLAIQLYNSGSGSSDLTLIPFLTLGMQNVPANARGAADILQSNFPSLHANFKIDSDGETIVLSSPELAIIDIKNTGPLPTDVSLGRYPDGGADYGFHVEPTPGASNDQPGFESVGSTPIFSQGAGFYSGAVELTISTAESDEILYYTLDGSVPTESSARYQSPLNIDETMVVRARVLGQNAIPGKTATHTFFINRTFDLPVISISTNPENFFDNDTGIYVLGDDYNTNNPNFGANFWEDWERPVHIELIETDGTVGIRQDAGAKIFGGWSRANAQKSLAFFARKQYGPGQFRYRIFPNKKIKSFESFIIRNSGNDWNRAHYRDAMMGSLLEDIDVDRQGYRPSVVYINGDYWGIMNIREKVNEHFIESNSEGVDSDELDLLERNATAIHGDTEHYQAMLSRVNAGNLANPAAYGQVKEMVDIENFIDYQVSQIYFDNTDWPGNNIKFWRPRTETGRWRWILYDTDFGFSIWTANNYTKNTLAFALEPNGPGWPNPPWSTLMLRQLVTSSEFVSDFVNRFATYLNTNFVGSTVLARIDEMASVLEAEMPAHRARWGSSMSSWRSNITNMRNFGNLRVNYVRSHLRSRFRLGTLSTLRLETPSGGGFVEIQGAPVRSFPFSGQYFRDFPVRLEARPHPGYRFVAWEGAVSSDQAEISVPISSSSNTLSAVFEIDCSALGTIVINEINYNAPDERDPGDWVELYNRTSAALDLSGWTFRDEVEAHVFTLPDGSLLGPQEYLVLCSDAAAFSTRYPGVDNFVGNLGYFLAGGGELLELRDAGGDLVDALTYEDESPWPASADGDGATIALRNSVLDNSYAGHWTASAAGGTPGSNNDDVYQVIASGCSDEPRFVRGDCNGDEGIDLSDPIRVLVYLFSGGEQPDCIAACDANADGEVTGNVTDALFLLNYTFLEGPAPSAPFPACGAGTESDDTLGCERTGLNCPE